MKDEPTLLHGEAQLHAFVDGRLDAAGLAAAQARLDGDPEAAATVDAWREQREALRGLHAELLQDPAPAALLAAARQLHQRRRRFGQWRRWGGIAASLLLAFGIGWAGHGQWQARQGIAGSAIARARLVNAFGHDALLAHAVYSPEVRHPVEVEAQQQEHLVQWLSKRLNRPLKVPNLSEQGYELVGGRLLPGDRGARAQFMYQNARGERVTLYVGAVDAPGAPQSTETAFRFTNEGELATFYWVDQGFGYAMAGKLPRARLLLVSEAVYRQL
ncbi:anti-sigma factor [Ramlibacter sp.]|uniref:anti-sigma factor family protein n=1 Tax=Ramlibacter sp. TaxID=1917967 RepID=UPI002BC1D7DE|nr:anti-sigma factor [Ramlibacter sp.]HWI83179.1 anti-sigma factor [Ramlibacter sp.]